MRTVASPVARAGLAACVALAAAPLGAQQPAPAPRDSTAASPQKRPGRLARFMAKVDAVTASMQAAAARDSAARDSAGRATPAPTTPVPTAPTPVTAPPTAASAPPAGDAATPAVPAPAPVGARVFVLYPMSYSDPLRYEATVLATRAGAVRVRYVDKDEDDAWVPADRIAAFSAGDVRGGPPLGKYQCWMPDRTADLGAVWTGDFALDAGGAYRYLTTQPDGGRYRYDARTRALTFVGGWLAGAVRSAEYYRKRPDEPLLVLEFKNRRRKGDYWNCLHRGAAPR